MTSSAPWYLRFGLVGVLVALVGVFYGCEDVVQISLLEAEPKLVIRGRLYSTNYVEFFVERSTAFDAQVVREPVDGAHIVISDSSGQVDTLYGLGNGVYEGRHHAGAGGTYQAQVYVDGRVYIAMSTMPVPMNPDSVTAVYESGGGVGLDEHGGYRIHVFFRDNPGTRDFARFEFSYNGFAHWQSALYDGKFSDGNPVDFDLFPRITGVYLVIVSLLAMDEAMYDYFTTLNEVAHYGGDDAGDIIEALDATPANPNTNWSGGALGYFAAFSADVAYAVYLEAPSGK